jgi:epoxyqueuosine reductase
MLLTSTDRDWIVQQARAAGFDLAGIAAVPSESSEEHAATNERFAAWIAAGHAGEMDYLKREDDAGKLVRGDLRRAIPWANSVIVCAVNYSSDTPLSIAPGAKDSGWIARYAWSGSKPECEPNANGNAGSDYHDVLLQQLRTLEAQLKRRYACETNCYVDTGPILERGYATRAGIGWIGRNTCVINQQQGSWLLLGVIVTSLELEPTAASLPAADRCGTCTRCIDACPTDALIPPGPNGHRQMDATRCIAYLTIEKKGNIPEELRAPMGRQVFGCDICQDVCPWNRKAPIAANSALPPRQDLINPSLDWLASLEGPDFTRVFRGSPVERTRRQTSRRKFFRRNVAIAMGNSGDAKFLPRLEAWASGDDPVLAETASWAVSRLRDAAK